MKYSLFTLVQLDHNDFGASSSETIRTFVALWSNFRHPLNKNRHVYYSRFFPTDFVSTRLWYTLRTLCVRSHLPARMFRVLNAPAVSSTLNYRPRSQFFLPSLSLLRILHRCYSFFSRLVNSTHFPVFLRHCPIFFNRA